MNVYNKCCIRSCKTNNEPLGYSQALTKELRVFSLVNTVSTYELFKTNDRILKLFQFEKIL